MPAKYEQQLHVRLQIHTQRRPPVPLLVVIRNVPDLYDSVNGYLNQSIARSLRAIQLATYDLFFLRKYSVACASENEPAAPETRHGEFATLFRIQTFNQECVSCTVCNERNVM